MARPQVTVRLTALFTVLLCAASCLAIAASLASAESGAFRYAYDRAPTSTTSSTRVAPASASSPVAAAGAIAAADRRLLAAEDSGITAADGTEITGYTRHGLNRAIGDGPQAPGVAQRAGTDPGAILDALQNPQKISEGVDQFRRPYKVYSGSNARVVVSPQTGRIISTNPLGGAGVRGGS